MKHRNILGIDPGTREMGLALVRDCEPRYFGVRTLRDGDRPSDVIEQAKRIVLEAVEDHQPQVVAIEQPFSPPTLRSQLLDAIANDLQARASELRLNVARLAPEEVRRRVTGNPRATRIEVARHLAGSGLDQISTVIAKQAARSAFGPGSPPDKHWLPMVGALAIALAARGIPIGYRVGIAGTGARMRSRGIED